VVRGGLAYWYSEWLRYPFDMSWELDRSEYMFLLPCCRSHFLLMCLVWTVL